MNEEKESIPSPQLPGSSPDSSPDRAAIQKAQPHSEQMTTYDPVKKDPDDDTNNETGEPDSGMNFMGHLEEIRSRLIKSAIALVLVTGLCTIFADFLVNDILIAPLRIATKAINQQPAMNRELQQ